MFIDASNAARENDLHLRQSSWAMENIALGNACTDLLLVACALELQSPEQVAVLGLGIRLINAAGAGGDAALHGYYAQAAGQVRDLIETGFHLDLFRRKGEAISRWLACTDRERRSEFSAFALRTELDKLDAATQGKRAEAYSMFSRYGTHIDPTAQLMAMQNALIMVGPFPDRDRVQALSFDLARYLAAGTTYFMGWLTQQTNAVSPLKAAELERAWDAVDAKMKNLASRKSTDPTKGE